MDNYGDFDSFDLILFLTLIVNKKKIRVCYIKIIFNIFQVKYSSYILYNFYHDNNNEF